MSVLGALSALKRGKPAEAVERLHTALPYERAVNGLNFSHFYLGGLHSAYVRGEALIAVSGGRAHEEVAAGRPQSVQCGRNPNLYQKEKQGLSIIFRIIGGSSFPQPIASLNPAKAPTDFSDEAIFFMGSIWSSTTWSGDVGSRLPRHLGIARR